MSIVNLQSSPIFVRSPYIIEIDEPAQIEGRVDIYIWNNGDTPPSVPTYTLSKKIPNSSNLLLTFNISHYVREAISFNTSSNVNVNLLWGEIFDTEWAFVKVITKVKYNGDTSFTTLTTKTWIALDGYGYYEQGYNPDLGNVLLQEGVYEYWYDPNNLPIGFQQNINRYGDVKIVLPQVDYQLRYTDLVTGATFTTTYTAGLGTRYIVQPFLVYPLYAENGNLIEYLDDLGAVIWSATIKPITECKYQVHSIDFVNNFGAWQRSFAFKVSRKSINVTTEQHDLFNRDLIYYNYEAPENKLFNVNGKKQIKVNTGWIYNESYNDIVLQPMMLSERISIDDLPVIMQTRSTELYENINQHLINYELTFEYSYDVINNVV